MKIDGKAAVPKIPCKVTPLMLMPSDANCWNVFKYYQATLQLLCHPLLVVCMCGAVGGLYCLSEQVHDPSILKIQRNAC